MIEKLYICRITSISTRPEGYQLRCSRQVFTEFCIPPRTCFPCDNASRAPVRLHQETAIIPQSINKVQAEHEQENTPLDFPHFPLFGDHISEDWVSRVKRNVFICFNLKSIYYCVYAKRLAVNIG